MRVTGLFPERYEAGAIVVVSFFAIVSMVLSELSIERESLAKILSLLFTRIESVDNVSAELFFSVHYLNLKEVITNQ